MRRGMSYVVGFLVAFGLLVAIAAVTHVFLLTGGLGDASEFNYQVEGVTRFQSCDITLLAILRADTGEGYDFADAISLGKWGDVKADAQKYIDTAINEKAEIRLAPCAPGEICCSQIVPLFTATSVGANEEVSIVASE